MQRFIWAYVLSLFLCIPAFAEVPTEGTDPTFLLSRLEAMQQEIQELRGQLEVQAHDLKMLHQQQKAFYQDLDKRLVDSSAKPKPANKAFMSAPTQESVTSLVPQDKGDAKDRYAAAYKLVEAKRFPEATAAMQQFLQDFPEMAFTANAHYWLGELYLSQKQTEQAISELNTVVSKYPKSTKMAAASLKLGVIYYEQQKWAQAKAQFKLVKTKFPDTSTARLASVHLMELQRRGL